MAIPTETLEKMQSLSMDKMTIVIDLVNQLASSNPVDLFDALCENGAENPMDEEEVRDFVASVRTERHALSH